MRRFVMRALAVVAGLLTVAVIGTYMSVRRSLPTINGTTTVPGISAPIDIIPRRRRHSTHLCHDEGRRAVRTRLRARAGSPVADGVPAPHRLRPIVRNLRTRPHCRRTGFSGRWGSGAAAKAAWDRTPEWAKQQVNAYVSGVNAFLATHHGTALPLEFSLLRFEPEAWSGPDVIVWVKMMAWDLSSNYALELLRYDLARTVGQDRMAQLMPPYAMAGLSIMSPAGASEADGSHTSGGLATNAPHPTGSTLPGEQAHSTSAAWASALTGGVPEATDFLLGGGTTESLGSNNWVVDGTRTASGKPLLANDPHLGTRVPRPGTSRTCRRRISTSSAPRCPAPRRSRSAAIASSPWGATNVAADVEDFVPRASQRGRHRHGVSRRERRR
jgi:penicillin amidase